MGRNCGSVGLQGRNCCNGLGSRIVPGREGQRHAYFLAWYWYTPLRDHAGEPLRTLRDVRADDAESETRVGYCRARIRSRLGRLAGSMSAPAK